MAGRRRVWGWMLFDVAQQPYATLGLTFVFGPYFAEVAAAHFGGTGLDAEAAGARAQTLWGTANLLSGLLVAVTAPLLGAWVDASGRKLPWVVGLSVPAAACAAAIWGLAPDGSGLWTVLLLFWLGFALGEAALNINNAQLPDVAPPEEVGRVSGTGGALGYWGGVVALALALLLVVDGADGLTLLGRPPAFGLDGGAREGTRAVGPFIGLWLLAFLVPYAMWTGDPRSPRAPREPVGASLRRAWAEVRGRPSLRSFLLASMLYRDGLAALYSFGAIYAGQVLGWDVIRIGVFGITAAVAAAIITWAGGHADRRLGPKPVIVGSCWALLLVCAVVIGVSRETIYGIALPAGSGLPDILFFLCGGLIGGAGGAIYSASRTLMVRHADPARPGEAFGLFGLSGRATAFLAPGLVAGATALTGSVQMGFVPVVALFLVALLLLRWTDPQGDLARPAPLT